jgi:predicted CopG family antitoxin
MISLNQKTYKELAQLGTLEDSFDSVISRMIQREKIAMSGRTLAGSSLNTATASQLSEGYSRDNG